MPGEGNVLVGLAGGSASGKTTLVRELALQFGKEQLCVVSLDHYYKPLSHQLRDAQGEINFDHPKGIDFRRMRRDVRSLLKGQPVKIVEYTFNNPLVFPGEIVFEPAPIIVVEGLFAFADTYLNRMYSYTVYVDAPLQVAFDRRMKRDVSERGMTQEEVRYQWDNHVLPAYHEFLLPHRDTAHFVIDNSIDFKSQLTVLEAELRTMV